MKILIPERRDTKNLGVRHLTLYHKKNKKIGAHVGGQKAIDRALEAGIDIFHHAHGITKEQIKKIIDKKVVVVATPLGGTHLPPNSPEEVVDLAINNIIVSIATDAYLPPSKNASWLNFKKNLGARHLTY